MKLRIAIAAIAAFSVGGLLINTAMPAHAQAGKRQRRAGKVEPVEIAAFKASGATSDADTKFEALYKTYDDARKNTTATVTDKKAARQQNAELRKKFLSDSDALLAPDQITKFHQGLTTIPLMRVFERDIQVTPDEKAKIEPILADYATKTDGMKAKDKRNALEEIKPKIRETLTPDQQTRFDLLPPGITGGGNGRRNATAPVVTPPAAPPTTPGTPGVTPPVPPTTPANP